MADFTKTKRDRAKSQGFAAFRIPVGSILVFKKDPAVTVKTLDDKNKVEYQGKPYSISTLAKRLVGSPVSGYLYFKFGGKALKSLAKSEAKSVAPEVTETSEVSMESEESKFAGKSKRGGVPLSGKIEVDAVESAGDGVDDEA